MVGVKLALNSGSTDLREDARRLGKMRFELAQRLTDCADQLESPGIPPAATLVADLVKYCHDIQTLADLVGPSDWHHPISLAEIETKIDAIDCRRAAQEISEQLAELKHVDAPDFAPLVLCQREALRLCQLANESFGLERNSELDLLRQNRHPLNDLIRLCHQGNQLSDLDWTESHDNVAATYGRQLATALTRGRIHRSGIMANDPPLVTPMGTSDPKAKEPVRGQLSSSDAVAGPGPAQAIPLAIDFPPDSIFEPAATAQSVFDVEPVVLPPPSQLNREEARFDSVSPSREIRSVPRVLKSQEEKSEPARAVPIVPSKSNLKTADWIVRLINEDRLTVAQHLTRCLEQKSELADIYVPSWLLRALILGRHLSYSKGEIARCLDDELREFRSEHLLTGSDVKQLTLSFTLRAAALPAALLAGSSAAVGILRLFKIAPGYSQLYNYCSRIALYGDRLAGSLVEMFRPAGTIAGASELDELCQSAQEWLQDVSKRVVSYSRSSPLFLHAHWTLSSGTAIRHSEATFRWCKWQETLSVAYRLLKPVCEKADSERNWVRQEIARLTSQIRVEPIDSFLRSGTQNNPSARGLILPDEEMRSVLLEAVGIANRWLRLNQQTLSSVASPIPLEALELRDEILGRTNGVLNELSQQRQLASSPHVIAGITCCQNTIRRIHALFESRLSLSLTEPDPRHVLYADLLRIPGIDLNDQWQPVNDVATLERDLVTSLEVGELTWKQSFDFHSKTGNHEATGRLLELDVWSSPEERSSCAAIRSGQIVENRNAVLSELDELAADCVTVAETGKWSEAESVSIQKRVERLRHELPRTTNFAVIRRQIGQLQTAILRQNSGHGLPTALLAASTVPEGNDSRRSRMTGSAVNPQTSSQPFDIFSGE